MTDLPVVRFDIIENPACPEFAPLTFQQRAARWFGRAVKPHRAFYFMGERIYCHPENARMLREGLPTGERR